jgi:hypothetical protein
VVRTSIRNVRRYRNRPSHFWRVYAALVFLNGRARTPTFLERQRQNQNAQMLTGFSHLCPPSGHDPRLRNAYLRSPGIQSSITVNGVLAKFGGVMFNAIRCPSGLKAK